MKTFEKNTKESLRFFEHHGVRMSHDTLCNLAAKGLIKAYRNTPRSPLFFHEDDLKAFLEKRGVSEITA
ncbi:MAG: hypothetical protein EKK48_29840 [Candidatus Melainabacteria bacterium]|nr:MAG: hypothetical protein EKK48_29840 [Candidatus Melainabacteria bacterium]